MIKNVEIPGKDHRMEENEVLFDRFLGSRAVSVLNHWFQSNRDYPYPDDERTDRLAREAGKYTFGFFFCRERSIQSNRNYTKTS